MSQIPRSVRIFRRAELGADLTSLLQAAEALERRRILKRLYRPLPGSITKLYRRIERDAAKQRQHRLQELDRHWTAVLLDPKSSEEDKRLARVELVALSMPAQGEDGQ